MSDSTPVPVATNAPLRLLGRLKQLVQGVSMMFLWIGLVFAGAGRLNWLRGWLCAGVYVFVMSVVGSLVHRFNPGLMEARERWMRTGSPPFDRCFISLYVPLTFLQVLVAGLDAGRFRWLPLPRWTIVPGIILFVVSMGIVLSTFLVNPFAESTVRIQADRGHKVISTGPYRIVRHPMYVGSILLYPATAWMFGSGWALIVAAMIGILIVWRTAKEDRFLHGQLKGYSEYASHTRFRLLPGMW